MIQLAIPRQSSSDPLLLIEGVGLSTVLKNRVMISLPLILKFK